MKQKQLFGMALLAWSFQALAITSADTLPKGVGAAAFVYGVGSGIQDKFNSAGLLESLVSPLNRSLTVSDIAPFSEDLQKLQTYLDSLGPSNLGDKLFQVDLHQDLAVTEQRYVFGALWGISDRYSIGPIVPMIKREYKANFTVDTRTNIDQLEDTLGNIPVIRPGLEELRNYKLDANLFADRIFNKSGYQTPSSFRAKGLGDIEIEGRYAYFRSTYFNAQFRHSVKFPTATHKVDVTNLLDRPLGQGHYSAKLSQLNDFKILPGILSWNTAGTVVLHAPGRQLMAVRKNAEQILPDLHDPNQIENVRMQAGTDFGLDTGLMLDIWRGVISLSGSYIYNYHYKDRYSGNRGLQYDELSTATDWSLHSVEMAVEFSTIPLFLKKILPVPARFTFTWNQPLKGYNTEFAPYGRVDVIVLF